MSLFDKTQNPADAASHWCIMLMTDKLTDQDYAAFMAWCDETPENPKHLDDAIRAWQLLDPISSSPAMIDLRSHALKDFRRAQASAHAIKIPKSRWIMAMAATVLLMISASAAWYSFKTDIYSTSTGERRIVALEDGSHLSLDADTKVRVKYSGKQRQLWLEQGRARFDVAHNPQKPFTVNVAEKSVLATGTQFSIEHISKEVHVVLIEGHVSVFNQDRQGKTLLRVGSDTSDRALKPGQELISEVGSASATVTPVVPEQTLAWETGQLIFDETPLANAVEQVNRYTHRKIRLGHLARQDVRVSGVYKAGDTDAFVSGVTKVSGLVSVSENGNYVLESKRD